MSAPLNPGDIIDGKYRIDRVLGEGGMGVVLAAHHLLLDERVAIKILLPDAAQSADAVTRFAREARAAAKIHGEHVVRVSDVGTLPDGAAYMVMEYLEGVDLKSEMDRRGALPCEEAVELILQALEAMAEAHVLGIVHRDLKPANLFLARRRGGAICLKVLDFGISRMSGSLAAGATGATATGSTFGTPLYMAPEQWVSAKHADARSDIWSLGAILYHALAGRPPFQGESIPSLWHAIGNDPPPPLRSLRADVPPALEAAVARCLQKKPDNRFRTVGELASALGPVAPARARARVDRVLALSHDEGGGEAIAAAPAAPVIGTPAQRTVTAYGLGTLPPTLRSKGTKVLVLGGVVVLIAVIGGGWLLGARDAPSRAALAPSAVAPGLVATGVSAPSSAVTNPAPFGVASAPAPSAANELAGAPAPPPSSRAEMVPGEPPTAVGTAPNPAGRPLPSTPMPKRGAVPPARSTSQHGSSPTAPPPAPRPSRPNADKFE